jgi:MarR family transcriptional regulator, temperature-dependent positive regulator of motility
MPKTPLPLKRFQAKWAPVRVKKTRQIKNLEPRFDSIETEKALGTPVPLSHRVPGHLARRFHQICLGVTAEILEREGLTPLIYAIMADLQERPGSGQRELASRLGIDPVSVGQMIDSLDAEGLVDKRVHPSDRRARVLRLTRRGAELRRRLRPSLLAAQERLLTPLSLAERKALLSMLARVIAANQSYARPGNGRRKTRRSHLQEAR